MARALPLLYRLGKTPTPDLTPFERAVLGVYLAHAGLHDGGSSYPSGAAVARILAYRDGRETRSYSTRHVRRARARLVVLGYLTPNGYAVPTIDGVERTDKATRRFTARIASGGTPPSPLDDEHEPEREDTPVLPDAASGRTPSDKREDTQRVSRRTPMSPEAVPVPYPTQKPATRGKRASARKPRATESSKDVGLTAEEIAERNRLDLAWKREQAASRTAKAARTARGIAALPNLTGDQQSQMDAHIARAANWRAAAIASTADELADPQHDADDAGSQEQ